MATSGSFYKYPVDNFTYGLYCTWSCTQSISGNYSDVTLNVYLKYYAYYTGTQKFTMSINGTSETSSHSSIQESDSKTLHTKKIGSKKVRVNHNTDGTKKITLSSTYTLNGTIQGQSVGSYTASATVTLDTIPRQSSVALDKTSVDVGSAIKATITRNSSSFTHKVEFYINSNYISSSTGVGTSKSFTIPTSWYAAMPSSTSCTAYCKVTTYNGSTKIGSAVTKSFKVTVPSSIKPSIGSFSITAESITLQDGSTQSLFVQGKNKATFNISSCSPGTSSTISSYAISGPSVSISKSSSDTSLSTSVSSITSYGTDLEYTVTVKDARGRTATKTVSITVYQYYAPSINSFSAYRADSSGTADPSTGTYLQCTCSASYASVNSTNNIYSITYKYKTKSSSTYLTSTTLPINLNSDITNHYDVQVVIVDMYGGTSSSSIVTVQNAERPFNIARNGKGVAIGQMSTGTNGLFEVAWDTSLKSSLTVSNSITSISNIIANNRIIAGTSTSSLDGTPGCILDESGYMVLKSTDNPQIGFYPSSSTSSPKIISASSSGFTLNSATAISGSLSSTGNIYCGGSNITYTSDYTSAVVINCKWADGSNHNLLYRSANGLTAQVGWVGATGYKTVLNLNATTINANNTLYGSKALICGTVLGCSGDYTTTFAVYCKWADGSNHNLAERSSDGLSAKYGWAGSSDYKSKTIIRGQTVQYANSSGTSTLSDIRLKKDIGSLEEYEMFYNLIEPVKYKYVDGNSGRYHIGYKAQQVKEALDASGLSTQDFAGYIAYDVDPLSDEYHGYTTEYGLIYSEFTALNTYMIQKLLKRINVLEGELSKIKNKGSDI